MVAPIHGCGHAAPRFAPARRFCQNSRMSTSGGPRDGNTAEREFFHTRLIDAPRGHVFAALADPDRVARWWGPNGFRSTIEVFEFRPGGAWRLTMHGPDGTDYPNESVFLEIVEPERVLLEHMGHHFFLTITFEDEGGRTRVGWRQVFDTAEHRNAIAAVVPALNEQNLNRLTAEVLGAVS